jgi:hypothetical protein
VVTVSVMFSALLKFAKRTKYALGSVTTSTPSAAKLVSISFARTRLSARDSWPN